MMNEADDSLAVRVAGGAIRGAWIAPIAVLLFSVFFFGGDDIVFSPSWEGLWHLLSVPLASVPAGACLGASLNLLPARMGIFIAMLPIGGAITGAVFWLLRPEAGLAKSVFAGVGFVILLVVLGAMEEAAAESGAKRKEPESEVIISYGPPQECPRCHQETRNPHFCEICGKDLRENPPPVVMPNDRHNA